MALIMVLLAATFTSSSFGQEHVTVRTQAVAIHLAPLARSLSTWKWIMRFRASAVTAVTVFVFADFLLPLLDAKIVPTSRLLISTINVNLIEAHCEAGKGFRGNRVEATQRRAK